MKRELVYPDLSYKITGILFETHNELGRFRAEKQYGDLIEFKLKESGIMYERERTLPVSFKGEEGGRSRVDFIIENKLILELKSKRIIDRNDYYQLQRYLVCFDKRLGLLINFSSKYLTPKRVLNPNCKD